MEIKLTLNKVFWLGYVFFCVVSTLIVQLLGLIDVRTMDRPAQIIFIGALILSGMVMRYWFRSNPDEVKKLFKS